MTIGIATCSQNCVVRIIILLLALVLAPRPVAADWASELFETTQHDFRTIAAGAKAEFAFRFRNTYLYAIHVASVRSSCGCSDVRVSRDSLAAYETGEVVAIINSSRLRGKQSSTLTVVFDEPRYAEVQLNVAVFIRGDVLLEPPGIDFGEVDRGAEAPQELTVTHYGDAEWKLVDVLGSDSGIQCQLGEAVRSGSRVSYPLRVMLTPDALSGYLRTELLLVSNDANVGKIPVMVEGRIRPPLSVAPACLFLGSLRPGQSVTKNIVVRASTPFHIKQISTDCECFEFSYTPDEPKSVHLVPVKFTAGESPAGVKRTIRIETDFNGDIAEVVALAAVDERAK